MNPQSKAMTGPSIQSQGTVSATRAVYWSIRRELWENRSIYIGPLVAAVLFSFGFVINMVATRHRIGALPLDAAQQHDLLAQKYELSAALIMRTAFIVGIFYSLDALYGERVEDSHD